MKTEDLYELLQDYHDPNGSVLKGVRKTKEQWIARFALLTHNDIDIKTDWFKKVGQPMFNLEKRQLIERLGLEYNLRYRQYPEGELQDDSQKRRLRGEGFLNAIKLVSDFFDDDNS